jgi:adenine/guanine phosphoribosyltransferase-like PRPP-binding protein
MNKLVIKQPELNGMVAKICREIALSGWQPDYIVGITRGGLIPAVMISQYLNVPMHTLSVSLRDSKVGPESNLWMAEDALGPQSRERFVEDENDFAGILSAASDLLESAGTYKNILIVDDINDTGATFNWIMKDWPSSCFPKDPSWEEVWNNNVKFAVAVDNLASKCSVKMDFVGMEINKAENNVWVDFPWEDWWAK